MFAAVEFITMYNRLTKYPVENESFTLLTVGVQTLTNWSLSREWLSNAVLLNLKLRGPSSIASFLQLCFTQFDYASPFTCNRICISACSLLVFDNMGKINQSFI
jgi:hypothetical protein